MTTVPEICMLKDVLVLEKLLVVLPNPLATTNITTNVEKCFTHAANSHSEKLKFPKVKDGKSQTYFHT